MKTHRKLLEDFGLLSLLLIIISLVTWLYISHENTFYFWDDAQYQDMTTAKAIYFRNLLRTSPLAIFEVLWRVWKSTAQDYSDLHTVLSIPFILIFGTSRLTYILNLSLLYLLPFCLAMGAIATKLIPHHPRFVFWFTAFFTLLTPATWLPTLRGYPDTGSAVLIAVAIFIYLKNPALKQLWQTVAIGCCLTLAILFRRHFIYDAISFFSCITLHAFINLVIQARDHRKQALANFLNQFKRIVWLGISTFIFLVFLGLPFIYRVITTNFSLLYASYEQPIGISLEHYRSYYGWIALLLAVLGILAGVLNHVLVKPTATFIALIGIFSIVQWVLKVKQLGFHYTMHFTPWVVLGLSAFCCSAWYSLKGKTRKFVLGASILFFCSNLLIGLAPSEIFAKVPMIQGLSSTSLPKLFSYNYPPQQREDYAQIAELVNYLREVSSPEEPIYVAGSSAVISDDLLWQANRKLHEDILKLKDFWQSEGLNVLHWVPFADSRDPYPLEKLFYSNYVVIATPVQGHLRPEEHDVVRVVVDAFTQSWEFAQDFVRLPREFSLKDNVTVSVYERIQPTSLETAIRTLKAMQDYVGSRPHGQLSWVSLSETPGYYIERNLDGTHSINFYGEQSQPTSTWLIYLDAEPGQTTLTGNLGYPDQPCQKLLPKAAVIDSQGQIVSQTRDDDHSQNSSLELSLPLETTTPSYVALNISSQSISANSCSWSLSNLSVFSN